MKKNKRRSIVSATIRFTMKKVNKIFINLFLVLLVSLSLVGCKKTNKLEEFVKRYELDYNLEENLPDVLLAKKGEGNIKVSWSTNDELVEITEDENIISISIPAAEEKREIEFIVTFELKDEKMSKVFTGFKNGIEKTYDNIADVLKKSEGESVLIKGVVYSKAYENYPGYYIEDETGRILIYSYNKDVELGDLVEIKGSLAYYHGLPQIKFENKDSLRIISKNNDLPSFEKTSISEIQKLDDTSNAYGKRYKVQAKVVKKLVDFETRFYLEDPVTQEQIEVYYMSRTDIIGLYTDLYVEVEITLYTYHTENKQWQVYYSPISEDSIKQIDELKLTVDEKLNAVETILRKKYENKTFYDNIDLLDKSSHNSSIKWVSNSDLIDDNGFIKEIEGDNKVSFNVKIEIDSTIKEIEIFLNISKLEKTNLKDVILLDVGTEKRLNVTGVVVDLYGVSGFYMYQDGAFLFVNDGSLNAKPGDLIEVIGRFTNSNRNGKTTPKIDRVEYSKIISENNTIPKAKKYSMEELSKEGFDSLIYNTYVELEATIKMVPGAFGNSTIMVDDNLEMTFQGNSNTYGLIYFVDHRVKVRGFLHNRNKNGWNLYLNNSEGDIVSLESRESILEKAEDYLFDVLPNDIDLNVDLILPKKHPVYDEVEYIWTSSNEDVLTNDGKYVNKDKDQTVKLEVTIKVKDLSKKVEFDYNVLKQNENGANDLMFTFIMRGKKQDKMFAIYNGTGKDIDLKDYKIVSIQNSGSGSNHISVDVSNAQGVMNLKDELMKTQTLMNKEADGILKDGETIIIHHVSITRTYLDQMENTYKIPTPNTNGVAAFNAKDGDIVGLMKGSLLIDKIGTERKIPKNSQAAWEEKYLQIGLMLIREKNTNPTPALNWFDEKEVSKYWGLYVEKGVEVEYELPLITYDFKNGTKPNNKLN